MLTLGHSVFGKHLVTS